MSFKVKWFKYSITIASCVLIIVLGLAFLVRSPIVTTSGTTTIIGEDLISRKLTVLIAEAGRTATIVVAAADSSPLSKAQADFVADGVNDQVTIQRAINALPAGGGTVLLLEGTYNIATPQIIPPPHPAGHRVGIIIPSNVTLKGQGGSTILRLKSGLDVVHIALHTVVLLNGSHIKVEDFKINLNGTAYTAGTFSGVLLSHITTHSTVSNLIVTDCRYGEPISVAGSRNTIINNTVNRAGGDGIGLAGANENLIIGNVVDLSNPHGWIMTEAIDVSHGSHRNTIIGNLLTGVIGIGLRYDCNDNLIQGNIILNPVSIGITFQHSSNRNTIIGNHITGTQTYGISSGAVGTPNRENNIKGNTIIGPAHSIWLINETLSVVDGNTLKRGGGIGIFASNSNFITITNNLITEKGHWGIRLSTVSHSTVTGNTFRANAQLAHDYHSHLSITGGTFNYITGNMFRHADFTFRPRFSIELLAPTSNMVVTNNDLRAGAIGTIQNLGVGNIIHHNQGFATENSGTATFSGTGAVTTFTFAHGLAATPTVVNLEARSAHAVGDKHWSADATNITVTFITAPPTGTNNVVIGWSAKVRVTYYAYKTAGGIGAAAFDIPVGRTATIVVAARDSAPQSRAQADFVADGTDDQVEIQAAINALPAGGGKVLLMEGTYSIAHAGTAWHASIVLTRPNTTLSGVGRSTVLRLKDAAGTLPGTLITIPKASPFSAIKNLKIDGNKAKNPGLLYNPVTAEGFRVMHVLSDYNKISGLEIINPPAHGIEVFGSHNTIVHTLISGSGGADNFATDPPSHSNIFANNHSRGSGGDGFDISSDSNVVVGNVSRGDLIGFTIAGKGNTVQGNAITNSGFIGAHLSGSFHTFKGNVIRGSDYHAIRLKGASHIQVLGNTIYEISAGRHVIQMTNAHHNLIQDNRIVEGTAGLPASSIRIFPPAGNNIIRGNHLVRSMWGIFHTIHGARESNTWSKPITDHFMNVLAASVVHVHPAIVPDGLTKTAVSSPDVPRNIMIRITNTHATLAQTPSGGNIVVKGMSARGKPFSETLTVPATPIPAGGTLDVFGSRAFATVSQLIYYTETNVNITVSVGTSDRLGLSDIIHYAGEVFKVKRGTVSIPVGVVDVVNRTVDLAPITSGDDITIWYRSNLNNIEN